MEQELKLREYPIFGWLFGLSAFGYGVFIFVTGGTAFITHTLVSAGVGLLSFVLSYILTVTADKQTGMLTLDYRSVFHHSVKEIPINQIQSIFVSRSRGSRSTTYCVEAILKSGERVPFRSYSSSGSYKKQKWADQLRSFLDLGDGFDETPMGIFRAAPKVGAAAATLQQEAMTGSNAEMRTTDGVNWQLQSFGLGATPGIRWFSPDFKTRDSFLFLAQVVPGQSSSGLIATLSKTLFKQSLALYGFSGSDTPNIAQADTYASLAPTLATHFMAFTNNQNEARQILNPWAQNPLTEWGTRYPLQQFQAGSRFTQIVVLYSPNGVYIATQGVLPPDKLDEVTKLGIELVKSQQI